jgi:hypothetical protein
MRRQRVVVLLAMQDFVGDVTKYREGYRLKISIPRLSTLSSCGQFFCGKKHDPHAATQGFPPHMEG